MTLLTASPTPSAGVRRRPAGRSPAVWLRGDSGSAQFSRFVLVGAIANALYALLFLAVAGFGDIPANVAGAIASSALANELHRRLTFRAGERVSWQAAQWEGGVLAAVGAVLTSLALSWWEAVTGTSDAVTDLAVIAVVTGGVGLVRFIALRWIFRPRTPVSG